MPYLKGQLEIERCPHCNVDKPSLNTATQLATESYDGSRKRQWRVYVCGRCGGAVLAGSHTDGGVVREMYPSSTEVHESIPKPAQNYLKQALDSLHAPAGSVMLSASAVDAMLKSKGYTEGSLYSRIDKAKEDHVITEEMALWAHEVRLDANEPRHADEEAPLPSEDDARRCLEFVLALGQFLFVLPARVERGRAEAKTDREQGALDEGQGQ